MQKKQEIRYIAIKDSQRIDYIRDFEDRINNLYPERPKTYFFKRGYPKRAMSIDEVVSWSMKDQVDDTDEQELSGCMKWGLCESSATKLYDIDD